MQRPSQGGFALVIALSLMAFVLLLLLSITTLVQVESVSATQAKGILEARANAQLALMEAIGELQEAAGPDQRITANADITSTGNVPQSQLLGVWDSIGVTSGGTNLTDTKDLSALATAYKGSYTNKTRGNRFRKWLISGDPTTVQKTIDFPQSAASANTIPLVGARTLGAPDEASLTAELSRKLIKAELLEIKNDDTVSGHYAWAVTGENLKARINLPASSGNGGSSERIAQRAGSPTNAIQVMNDSTYTFGDKFIDATGELSPDIEKATSIESLRLAGRSNSSVSEQELGAFYSDLSISSSGLLTDAKWGGWKKDLSLLAERSSLPSKLEMDGTSSSQVFQGAGNTMTHGAYWEDLWNYTRSYKPFTAGGLVEWDGLTPYYSVGPDWNSAVTRRGWQMRMPVLSKYMWLISFEGENVTGGTQLNLIAQPIIELWNPFSLPLKMPIDSKYDFSLISLPIKFQVYQGSDKLLSRHKYLTTLFKEGTTGVDTSEMATYSVDFSGGQTMQPGENGLYSDQSSTPQLTTDNKFTLTKGLTIQGGVKYEKIDHGAMTVLVDNTKGPIEIEYLIGGGTFHSKTIFSDNSGSTGSIQSQMLPNGAQYSIFKRFLAGMGNTFTLESTATPSLLFGAVMKTEIPITVTAPPDRDDEKTESEDARFSHHLYNALSSGRSYIGPAGGNYGIPEMLETSPFAFFARRVSNYSNIPISLDYITGNGLQGRELGAGGQAYMPTRELPIQPLTSMAQLQHAGLGSYHIAWDWNANATYGLENGHLVSHPHVSFAFGNSHASPFVAGDGIEALDATSPIGQKHEVGGPKSGRPSGPQQEGYTTTLHDKSWKANEALWDEWFLSGVGDWTNPLVAQSRNKATIINDFTGGNQPLPNARYTPDVDDGSTAKANINGNDGYMKLARYISNQGSFNVNSTSKFAWKAVLGGLDRQAADLIYLDKLSGNIVNDTDLVNNDGYAFSRFTLPNGQSTATTGTSDADRQGRYLGARKLTDAELDLLAEKLVEEVKLRGPFLSLSEFINRRLVSGNDDLAKRGALQTAIDKAQLNLSDSTEITLSNSLDVSSLLGAYENPNALKSYDGSGYNGPLYTAEGAPSRLSQADVLMPIAPSLSVRCDTFTIRCYGETLNMQGERSAKVWCEAVVKRQPEYVDSSEAADKQIVDLDGNISTLNTTNQRYGRKMEIVSFRWLSEDEI